MTATHKQPSIEHWRAPIDLALPPNVVVGSAYTGAYDGAFVGTGVWYNQSGLAADEFRWRVELSKGTWRLDCMTQRAPNQGILTFDISYNDGASWVAIGTFDSYAAAIARNISASFTGINVPTQTRTAILRARCPTKNPSSSAFFMVLAKLGLVRTA
jgi:hypothetical protein